MSDENLYCVCCEGTNVILYGDHAYHPTVYQFKCDDCGNCAEQEDNLIDAEFSWRNQEWSMIPYQKPGLHQYLNNMRKNS